MRHQRSEPGQPSAPPGEVDGPSGRVGRQQLFDGRQHGCGQVRSHGGERCRRLPGDLVQQLTQILLRHVLGDTATAMQARVAEMLFRTQKISVLEDGAVMAADDETVERHALSAGFGSVG